MYITALRACWRTPYRGHKSILFKLKRSLRSLLGIWMHCRRGSVSSSGRGAGGSCLLSPIRGFCAALQRAALPSPPRQNSTGRNFHPYRESGGRRKSLSRPLPSLILLPSRALGAAVADLHLQVPFSPWDTEVA